MRWVQRPPTRTTATAAITPVRTADSVRAIGEPCCAPVAAVNVTVDGADMTLAPTFWGAQPASYESAGTSAEPLCGETTKAFALVDALDETQQQEAILDSEVTETVLGAGQDGKTLAQEGRLGVHVHRRA